MQEGRAAPSPAVPHYPVVVVGSGPAGLTLTNLLGRHGIETLIVERNLTTVQEPRAVSIDDESLRTMQAAGLAGVVSAKLVPGYGSHYFTPGGLCFAKVEPAGMPYGYPRRNAFRQPVLEQQLRDGLGRFPGVVPYFGWELTSYEQTASEVRVTLTGPGEQSREVTCDYLIGCDGAASLVREKLGIKLEGTTFSERWLIVDLENNGNRIKHTEVFCDKRRPCITLPGPDQTRRFEFKLLAGEKDEDLLEQKTVERLLAAHGADPNATLRRKTVYRFHARVAPRWREGRVFLAGDAAHLTPPFAGQGMNSGIRDALNLSWKLAAVLQGAAGPGLLDSYEQERKDHCWQMINLALRMGRVMSPKTWAHGVVTQSAFRLLNMWPAARDYIAQMKYKPPPRFRSGFLVNGHGIDKGLAGRMLPQPRVVTADGREILLDDVAPGRFVLLIRDEKPAAGFEHLGHALWDRLGVVRIGLVPNRSRPAGPDGIEFVREIDDTLASVLAPAGRCALLLRPDHYVAAVLALPDPGSVVRALEQLLASAWSGATRADLAVTAASESPEPRRVA